MHASRTAQSFFIFPPFTYIAELVSGGFFFTKLSQLSYFIKSEGIFIALNILRTAQIY
jgi:hypothetical protein